MHTVRLAILSPSRLVRETVASRLADEPEVEVVGTAATIDSLIGLDRARAIDVVLVDLSLEPGPPLETLADVSALLPHVRSIVLGPPRSESQLARYVEAGASAALEPSASCATLLETMHAVAAGRPRCSLDALAEMVGRIRRAEAEHPIPAERHTEPLTSREAEVARLAASGLLNKQIARRLGLKPSTVKTHVARILRKTHVPGRRELALRARASGSRQRARTTKAPSGSS